MFDAIHQCNIPVVGYVHGSVFGGALGLMACCDYVIAEEKTQFCFSEVKLGLAPAVISSFVLKKTLYGKVAPFMLSAQVFNSDQAIDMGLAHQKISVPATNTEFDPTTHDIFKKFQASLNEAGPEAVRATKELIQSLQNNQFGPTNDLKENTTRVIAERRVCEEGQEGLQSFLEKRTPQWRLTENS
jgi:methylglutaconyl-CoA hydratase